MKDTAESTDILCSVLNSAVTYFAPYTQKLGCSHGLSEDFHALSLFLGGLLGAGEIVWVFWGFF